MKKDHQLNRVQRMNVRFGYGVIMIGFLLSVLTSTGCRQSGSNTQTGPPLFGGSQLTNNTPQQSSYIGNQLIPPGADGKQYSEIASEVQNLNQRLGAYDADNQLLNTEVASLNQKLQLANQYNQTVKQQLADTVSQIQKSEFG